MGTRVGTAGLLLDLKQLESTTSVEFGLKIKIKIGTMPPTCDVSQKSYDTPS